MEDYVFLVLGVVAIGGVISIAGIISDYRTKQSKLKIEALKQEVELENIRKESYLLETEKIRLEIEQTRQQLSLDPPQGKKSQVDEMNKNKSTL